MPRWTASRSQSAQSPSGDCNRMRGTSTAATVRGPRRNQPNPLRGIATPLGGIGSNPPRSTRRNQPNPLRGIATSRTRTGMPGRSGRRNQPNPLRGIATTVGCTRQHFSGNLVAISPIPFGGLQPPFAADPAQELGHGRNQPNPLRGIATRRANPNLALPVELPSQSAQSPSGDCNRT